MVTTASEARPSRPEVSADLLYVAQQVHQEFDAKIDPRSIDECITRIAAKFDDAKVRSFVPLLVRRYVRDELRDLPAGT